MHYSRGRLNLAATWLTYLLVSGCALSPFSKKPGPSAPYYPDSPKELQKTVLPDYVIEPPDVLTIEAVNLIPMAPYHLRPLDALMVQAAGLPEQAPLAVEYT